MATEAWPPAWVAEKMPGPSQGRTVAQPVNRVPAGATTTKPSLSANARRATSVRAGTVTGSAPPPTVTKGASPSADDHLLGLIFSAWEQLLPDSPSTVNVIGSLLVHAT